jgi:hypothetical protein
VQQLEPGRKRYLAGHLQTGASYRIVDNRAIDRGRFRVDNDLGGAGHPARRANAGISSRKHNRNPRSSCPANSVSELKKGKPKILNRQFHRIDSADKTLETIAPQRHLRIVFNPGRGRACGAENCDLQGS